MMHPFSMMRETKIIEDGCFFMENLKDYSRELLPLDLCGRLSYQIISREDGAAVKRMAAFVDSHQNSHFLQLPRWAGVKECWKWRGILVYRDGRVAGAMSVLIRPLALGMSVLYAPRGPVCDRNDPFVMSELLVAAEALALIVTVFFFVKLKDRYQYA